MEKESVVHSFDGKSSSKTARKKGLLNKTTISIFLAVVVLGVVSGYVISTATKPKTVAVTTTTNVSALPKGQIFGSDASAFKDSAEGVLKAGGIDGEGAYHLERPGGPSQDVYLTSSVIDLSQLIGKTIKVWGQTNAAQHAGWLMDVGRAQILN